TPGARTIATLADALLVDLRDDFAVTGEQRFGRAHLRAQRQLAFDQPVAAVLLVIRRRVLRIRPARAVGAFVHLAARAEVAEPRILRRAERARVEAIAAADAQVLGVQDHAVGGGEETIHRTHRRARRVGAMHAGHGDRSLARLAVVGGDDAAAVAAPRYLVFVLAGGDARVALDAAVGVTEEFHASHCGSSLRRPDLAERRFGFLHSGDRVEAVGGERVDALAQHHRIGAFWIPGPLVGALEPTREVERTPGHAFADALGDQRLHPRLGAVLRAGDPDPAAVLDAAVGRIRRIDLDVHVLLELGEPLVGSGLLAAAFVFDDPARREDQRELLGNSLVHRRLLHVEADVRHAELPRIRQGRILANEIRPRRIDRLTVHRD